MSKLPRFLERVFLMVGLTLLVMAAGAMVHGSLSSRRALAQFDEAQAALAQTAAKADKGAARSTTAPGGAATAGATAGEDKADFSVWSEKRIREYRASLLSVKDAPMAVLKIAKLKLRVPVFEGTSDLILNRGVGWIEGTAKPGDAGNGNIGMAGHRDGFFRGFKDIAVGDEVELSTLSGVKLYAVDSTEIVDPENVGVLRPRGVPSLTLVTCYPFYFVGDAPQRFIVHATLKRQVQVQ
jgi:sortase A